MVYLISFVKNLIILYVFVFLIFSPLQGQTNTRTTIKSQPVRYTVILAGGTSIHASSFKNILGDSLVLIENNFESVVPLVDIVRITRVGKNKFKKGSFYGATIGFGSSFLYKLSLFSGAQFNLLKYGWVAGTSVGTFVGGVTGAFLGGDKNQYMIGWSIDQKRAIIQKMIQGEK